MKKIIVVIGILALFVFFISVFKDLILKTIVINAASSVTGASVEIDGFSMDPFTSTIHMTGFRMYNPAGFPDGILVNCPKITVIYDQASLLNGKPHFFLVDLELSQMVLTKNHEGKLNVDALKIVHPSKTSSPVPMKIDLLNLSIGKIVYKDYTSSTEPAVRVFDINRHQSYKSIPTARQLALLVLSEPMKAAAIKDAEIYGVAMVAGVAMLPVAVIATFTAKDSVDQNVDVSQAHLYDISLQVLSRMGKITMQDASSGVIKANVNGSMVALKLKSITDHKTQITISARKFLLPELDIAGGVLYQIIDQL